jgi:small subunit ribosomal protein S1
LAIRVERSEGKEDKDKPEQSSEDANNLMAWLDGEFDSYPNFRRGDVVDGLVVRTDKDGIWLDVRAKSEGLVPLHEAQSLGRQGLEELAVGQEVLAYVTQPENQDGQIVLSIDRARGEKGWRVLERYMENGETFEAEVVDFNKGGLIVTHEGVRGFVPSSQLAGGRPSTGTDGEETENPLATFKDSTLRLKVIEMNRRRNRLILSERAALQEWRSQQRERLLSELREGEIRRGRVTSIRNFGAFIDMGGADGLAHLSELSWKRVKGPEEVVSVGDEVDVYVLKVDPDTKRIALSLRRAQPQPWQEITDRFEVGQLVNGVITKLTNFGAFARIEDSVEGLIHVSELAEHRIDHPSEVVNEGDEVTVRIVRIEPERYRLGLSLRQANNDELIEEIEEQEDLD